MVTVNFGGQDLFITYNGFGGNRGVGLFTAVPEPSSGVLQRLDLSGIDLTVKQRSHARLERWGDSAIRPAGRWTDGVRQSGHSKDTVRGLRGVLGQ